MVAVYISVTSARCSIHSDHEKATKKPLTTPKQLRLHAAFNVAQQHSTVWKHHSFMLHDMVWCGAERLLAVGTTSVLLGSNRGCLSELMVAGDGEWCKVSTQEALLSQCTDGACTSALSTACVLVECDGLSLLGWCRGVGGLATLQLQFHTLTISAQRNTNSTGVHQTGEFV